MHYTNQLLQNKFKIDPRVLELTEAAEKETAEDFKVLDDIMTYNQYKMMLFRKTDSATCISAGIQDMDMMMQDGMP